MGNLAKSESIQIANPASPGSPEHIEQIPSPIRSIDGAVLEKLHMVMGLQCNADCIMCYQTHRSVQEDMPSMLYFERLASFYSRLRCVKLQGGEPTVMQNCREVAIMLRMHPKVRISMNTNGIRLDGFWQNVLLEKGEQVDISLNAATEKSYRKIVLRGNFNRVLSNVRTLASKRRGDFPRLGITMVVLKDNFSELHQFVALAHELGVDSVQFAVDPVLSFVGLPSSLEIVAELKRVEQARQGTSLNITGLDNLRKRVGLPVTEVLSTPKRQCRIPFENGVVDANGNVRACVATWEPLGNLHELSLEEIWSGPQAARFRRRVDGGDFSKCEPWCPHNSHPSKLALLRKYSSLCLRDPGAFSRKIKRKITQIRRNYN